MYHQSRLEPEAVIRREPPAGDPAGSRVRERPLVLVVDDDEAVRQALTDLMESVDLDAIGFRSPRELMEAGLPDRTGCLVLDVRMPGGSGLDLQQQLVGSGCHKPIIFLTGHADIQMSVQAMKAGAVDFLTKPVRHQALLDAVTEGIERDHDRQRHWMARFRRRSIVVSRAKRMVDASIALFARFGGNDKIADLVSMLA